MSAEDVEFLRSRVDSSKSIMSKVKTASEFRSVLEHHTASIFIPNTSVYLQATKCSHVVVVDDLGKITEFEIISYHPFSNRLILNDYTDTSYEGGEESINLKVMGIYGNGAYRLSK
jgi:hypothetical protein